MMMVAEHQLTGVYEQMTRFPLLLGAGDTPEDVKERLRHWAQAVACNLQLLH
jgi:hypothetical protein